MLLKHGIAKPAVIRRKRRPVRQCRAGLASSGRSATPLPVEDYEAAQDAADLPGKTTTRGATAAKAACSVPIFCRSF